MRTSISHLSKDIKYRYVSISHDAHSPGHGHTVLYTAERATLQKRTADLFAVRKLLEDAFKKRIFKKTHHKNDVASVAFVPKRPSEKLLIAEVHVSNVDVVLRRTTYMGTHYFNQTDSRIGERRPREEWVPIAVPAIIDEEIFQTVQARLCERNPRQTPPRVVSGPTLLTGIARCGCPSCGGAMTIRTGKSGQYRYYACSRRATRGETACTGRSIRMEKLDGIVLEALETRVLTPERLPELLTAFLEKSDESDQRRREELALLRAAKTNSEGALNRLYELVEQGLASPSDRDFAERLTHHRQRIAALSPDIASLERQLASTQRRITPDVVGRFGNLLSEGLRGNNPALRQAYVRLLIDEVTVNDDQIHIRGSRKALERAVIAAGANARAKVPSFAREWRTQEDSNL